MPDFDGDEAKKKFKMADSKKTEIFKTTNTQYFLANIFGIGPWVCFDIFFQLNFYDCRGFQPKTNHPKYSWGECNKPKYLGNTELAKY